MIIMIMPYKCKIEKMFSLINQNLLLTVINIEIYCTILAGQSK